MFPSAARADLQRLLSPDFVLNDDEREISIFTFNKRASRELVLFRLPRLISSIGNELGQQY